MIPLCFGLALFWLGELGGEYFTLYLSIWLVIFGLCWLHLGWSKLKQIGFALFFILTMFPLPYFFNVRLMLQLRLISSKLGVLMIQSFGLPVTREGNIIDLGFTRLQVVEACSGLNSLISLLVLSLLLVYFYKAHIWKRCVVVLSSVPLAILANSLRIAITAILYRQFGHEIAQGFFHGFSGIVIFLICIPILLVEIKILKKFPPNDLNYEPDSTTNENKAPIASSDVEPKLRGKAQQSTFRQPVFLIAVILLGGTLSISQGVEFRERIPVKKSIAKFPLEIGKWKAESREKIDQIFLDELDLSEYVMLNYNNESGKGVNFYVAYYEKQSKGKSIHTPASCLPGQGWSIDEAGTVDLATSRYSSDAMKVNRVVMQYDGSKQLSYYWFFLRGRILSNVYQVKMYNFWDALTKQRTDGALIRLITPLYENEDINDAETRLQNFVKEIAPLLDEYIPGKNIEEHT
jgi:exosortase D (VPLPA-CTERM-specific)